MQGTLAVTGDDAADHLVNTDPLALLLAMLLDQQIPMEWAFMGPYRLRQRLGSLDAAAVAAMAPEALAAAVKGPPALHRFPGSMAKRIQDCCKHVAENYDDDAANIWTTAKSGDDLVARLEALPGYGHEKAKIFAALLAKRVGVRPTGWERAAEPFSDDTPRSVADIDSPESLAKVREWKKAMKAKGKSKIDKD
ncbi:MAG: HhH-GPD-type base excision DNA repair protein [Acidimicrobiales bacterium]